MAVNYDRIINELASELDNCNIRYISGTSTLVPAYYRQEIAEAIDLIIKCRSCYMGLKTQPNGIGYDPYRVGELTRMLKHEMREGEVHCGARLVHRDSGAKDLTIDAGGLRALMSYYATHRTDPENGMEGS